MNEKQLLKTWMPMRQPIGYWILIALAVLPSLARTDERKPNGKDVFLLPYFLGNGETGIYFAFSHDGMKFGWLNDGQVVVPAQPWGDESLI